MAREPYTINEVKAEIRNAVRNGLKNTAYYTDLQELLFQAARRKLKKDNSAMKPSSEDEHYPTMITGTLRKTNTAKKEFLSHTYSYSDLNAAKFIWNHPEKMRYVGNSPLGADKDKTSIDDRKNIEKDFLSSALLLTLQR